jgi:ribosomal protein L14
MISTASSLNVMDGSGAKRVLQVGPIPLLHN